MEKYISNKHKLMKETKQRRRRRKLRDGEEKSCYGYNNKNEEFKNWQKALNGIKRIDQFCQKQVLTILYYKKQFETLKFVGKTGEQKPWVVKPHYISNLKLCLIITHWVKTSTSSHNLLCCSLVGCHFE